MHHARAPAALVREPAVVATDILAELQPVLLRAQLLAGQHQQHAQLRVKGELLLADELRQVLCSGGGGGVEGRVSARTP